MPNFLSGHGSGEIKTHSSQFQVGSLNLYRGRLANEVEAEQSGVRAVAFFHPGFHAAKRALLNLDAHAFANVGGKADFEVRFESLEDFAQLDRERFLIGNVQEVGDEITVVDFVPLLANELEEDVAGEKGFAEYDGFASVFVRRTIARQGG